MNKDANYGNKDANYANKDANYANKDANYANKDANYEEARRQPILLVNVLSLTLNNLSDYSFQIIF